MIKQTLAAAGLTAIMATAANAEASYEDADECYFTEFFSAVSELPAGVHVKTGFKVQQSIIEKCEELTQTQATGLSKGLVRIEVDNNRSWEFTAFE